MNYLLLMIIITSIILVLPYTKLSLIKKIFPTLTVAFAIALAGRGITTQIIHNMNTVQITITATDEKNELSSGTEIWIKGVIIDEEFYNAKEIFSNNWIEKENGVVGWRSYDQPTTLNNTIMGNLPYNKAIKIVFESNKWRGKAIINSKEKKEEIDFFVDSEESLEYVYTINPIKSNDRIATSRVVDTIGILLFIGTFSLVLSLFYIDNKKKKHKDIRIMVEQREIWVDVLKIISAFAIVLIHISGKIYSNFNGDMQSWYGTLYVNSITRFAVPCFLMISGMLILSKNEDVETVITKRLPRLIIPLVIWSTIYIFVKKYWYHYDINILTEIFTIPFEHKNDHLWYIYQLIGLYLLAPILCIIYNNTSKSLKIYFIAITLLIPSFIDMIVSLSRIQVPQVLQINWIKVSFAEIGLCFLAKFIYDSLKEKKTRIIYPLIGSVVGFSMVSLSSYYLSMQENKPSFIFFEQMRFPVIIFAVSIFILFYSLDDVFRNRSIRAKNNIIRISNLTLGIYFIHILVITFIGDVKIGFITFSNGSGSLIEIILGAILYFSISLLSCYILSKIPYIKKIVC